MRIAYDTEFPLPLYYLRLEIKILRGVKDFEAAVSKICFPEERQRREAVEQLE